MGRMNDRHGPHHAAIGWSLVAVIVRVAWLARHPAVPAWDGAIYHRTAERIARGMGFVDTWNNRPPFRPTAFYPVGYPAALGALYRMFGSHTWIAGMLNVLAAAVCTACIAYLARRAFGPMASHVAAGMYAFMPGAVIYTSAFMTEPLGAALLCGAIVAAFRHVRTGSVASAIATGLLLGAGGLVRPPALLVAPVIAVCATHRCDVRALVRAVGIIGIASASVVAPWTIRNCRSLDGCALVSVNGGSNLFIGTDPSARGGYRDLRRGEGCDGVRGEVAKDRCYMALATMRIRNAPGAWLALAPAKIEQLLGHETSPVSYLRAATGGTAFGSTADPLYRFMTAVHRAVLLLACIGAMRVAHEPRRSRVVRLILGAVIALVGVHVVFFGVDRYHFVFTPLLCVLAAGAFRRVPTMREESPRAVAASA
jgi:4-amino-4-deoxy-L-arabinose transferase-like glycosyltransferase